MKAKHIFRYYLIYREHLLASQLEDDSDTITVENLVEFVDNNISDEDRLDYADKVWN